MREDNAKPSDEQAIEIIGRLKVCDYANEESIDRDILFLQRSYPEIVRLIFHDRRNLTPEQILEEAKRISKPILL